MIGADDDEQPADVFQSIALRARRGGRACGAHGAVLGRRIRLSGACRHVAPTRVGGSARMRLGRAGRHRCRICRWDAWHGSGCGEQSFVCHRARVVSGRRWSQWNSRQRSSARVLGSTALRSSTPSFPGEGDHLWSNRWWKYKSLLTPKAAGDVAKELRAMVRRRTRRASAALRRRFDSDSDVQQANLAREQVVSSRRNP